MCRVKNKLYRDNGTAKNCLCWRFCWKGHFLPRRDWLGKKWFQPFGHVHKYQTQLCLSRKLKKSFLIISVYQIFGFNQPAQMLCNIIFPTAKNFSVRSRCVFYFMFSLKFKAFVMFLTFLLFQSNLYIVLAHRRS